MEGVKSFAAKIAMVNLREYISNIKPANSVARNFEGMVKVESFVAVTVISDFVKESTKYACTVVKNFGIGLKESFVAVIVLTKAKLVKKLVLKLEGK